MKVGLNQNVYYLIEKLLLTLEDLRIDDGMR